MTRQENLKWFEAYQQAVYSDGRNSGALYFQANQYRDSRSWLGCQWPGHCCAMSKKTTCKMMHNVLLSLMIFRRFIVTYDPFSHPQATFSLLQRSPHSNQRLWLSDYTRDQSLKVIFDTTWWYIPYISSAQFIMSTSWSGPSTFRTSPNWVKPSRALHMTAKGPKAAAGRFTDSIDVISSNGQMMYARRGAVRPSGLHQLKRPLSLLSRFLFNGCMMHVCYCISLS